MKKLIALFGILALAACGGGDSETATTEDTTTVAPAAETAPVVAPMDTTMAAPSTMPMDSAAAGTAMPMDSAAAGATTTDSAAM